VIWRQHEEFYARGGCFERPASCGTVPTYNNMELTNNVGPLNAYWFELVRRQARNVYLNMQYGTDLQSQAWGATLGRVWRKVRAQPLRRLPVRAYGRVRRSLASFLA
jgi:hypothetical protein